MKRGVSTWLTLALALGGCSLIIDDPSLHVANRCAADVDCSGGAHCDMSNAMCVQEPTLSYDLWLEVAPPNDPTGQPITPVALGPYTMFAGPIPLPVPRQITARGTVRRDGVPVSAQITFTPAANSPTGTRSVTTLTMPAAGYDFQASLPSRGAYDVLVEPVGEFRATVPPFRASGMMGLTVGVADQAIQIVLPTNETHVAGTLVDSEGHGIGEYEVLAVDRASGVLVSSIATVTPEGTLAGAFSIALATSTPFDLVIRPTPTRQMAGLVPTYHVRPEVLLPDSEGHVAILVPSTVPAVHWTGTVEYPETRGMRPVANAVIQLHSDDVADSTTGVIGSLDSTLVTDSEGRYAGDVLPGTYTVTVTPSTDDELGVLREQRTFDGSLVGHVLRLPLRTVLGGTVQSPDGDLVRDAHIRATPTGGSLAGLVNPEIARLARPSTALSGAMGDFRLDLDVGVYDLVVEPPEGSGFAWTVVLDYGIGGSTATLADVMQVEAPVVVESELVWADGGELANAEVRAFAITPDRRAVMVGRTTADAHGHARMLVPASLESHDPTMSFRFR